MYGEGRKIHGLALGSADPDLIEVVDLSIKEARVKFGPGTTGQTRAEMHMA